MARSKVFVPTSGGLAPLVFERAFERQTFDGLARLALSADADWIPLLREIAFRHGDTFVCRYEERGNDLRIDTGNLSKTQVTDLTDRAAEYLESDPRHNFSLRSADGGLTVVLDEHNFLLVYGDIDDTAAYLTNKGFTQGTIALPTPHVHKDVPDLDDDAAGFRTSLRELG